MTTILQVSSSLIYLLLFFTGSCYFTSLFAFLEKSDVKTIGT